MKKSEWDLNEIHKKIVVKIPLSILSLFKYLDSKLDTEWMVFLKVKETKNNEIILSDEYFIPEQKVQTAHVEALEDPPNGFDVVVHKHPSGISSFSSTDYEYINSNYAVSLLWVNGTINDAVVQADVMGIKTWIKPDVEILEPEFDFPEELLEKFKKPEPKTKVYVDDGFYRSVEDYLGYDIYYDPFEDRLADAVVSYLEENDVDLDEVSLFELEKYLMDKKGIIIDSKTEDSLIRVLESMGIPVAR